MKGFTLYITTKLANPAYTPEVNIFRLKAVRFMYTACGCHSSLPTFTSLLLEFIPKEKDVFTKECLFSPQISAKCSIIDFTVTIKGLEDQLLGRVINIEKQV